MGYILPLRGQLTKKQERIVPIYGAIALILCWHTLTVIANIKPIILPPPLKVLTSIPELLIKYNLWKGIFYSLTLNILSYLEAVIISIILGYVIALVPVARTLFMPYINAFRFLAITAMTGIIINAFGIGVLAKVQFLALGIAVYMVPAVIQRIDDIPEVYLHTLKTLGARSWHEIRYIYIPAALPRFGNDVRILIAISWTYLYVAETFNSSDGGIGAMTSLAAKMNRYDMVYALLFIMMTIGVIQDAILIFSHRKAFKFLY